MNEGRKEGKESIFEIIYANEKGKRAQNEFLKNA